MRIKISEPVMIDIILNGRINIFTGTSGEGKTFISGILNDYSKFDDINVGVLNYNFLSNEEVSATINRIEKNNNPLLIVDNCDLLIRNGIKESLLFDNKCTVMMFVKDLNKLKLLRRYHISFNVLFYSNNILQSKEILSW